ncbi:MAG TPA: inositol monophosphatase family protein [Rhizobiaceae bacterium]|nr:inositol monophosphatase family protein [Rhizobiaceae bacterium]
MARSALLNVMVTAVLKAGKGLARDFGEVQNLQVSLKGPGDFVSQADMRAEKTLHAELARARPGYGFLMEEGGAIAGEDEQHRWLIDPLDGTTNFLHGIPQFCISVALERQGQLMAAVVYNPANDELYTAERGGGAFLNDRRLRVAGRKRLSDCIVGCGIPHLGRPGHGKFLMELRHVMNETVGVRRLGSVALDLAYVAAGRLDGFWEDGMSPWDMAAGALLIREAGGFVTDRKGGDDMFGRKEIVAGNEDIHRALLAQLRKADG